MRTAAARSTSGRSWNSTDTGRRAVQWAARSRCQTAEKVRANTMTMKEKIKIHAEIERENARKLKEWKEGKAA